MFKDMMYSRFIIHLYCRLDPTRRHLGVKLDQYVEWGASVLEDLDNMGYEVLKGIEALTQTALIAREETILDGVGQHQSMLDKYTEKEIKSGGSGAHVRALGWYLDSFTSSRDLAEAFGFLKLWGHPYVDPIEGCVSAKELAQQPLHLRLGDCARLEWSFCHIYCRGYLKKRGKWPPLRFIPRADGVTTALQGLYERNQPSLAFGFTQYPAEDWQWTQFEEHIPFDEGEDILSLVVDKSLSYDRDHFDSTWGYALDYKPPKAPTSSRVMEELISRPSIDLSEIVDRVAHRDIPHKWKIVTVCPKEREMKRHPRMFSMMVLEMRLFFVLTEHNIAQGVFSSLPEQTMTLSRQELLDLFLTSTRPTPDSWVRAVMGIDFSRWNLYWRKETVHPIGSRMDQMYGKPGVFSVVHDFFSQSLCMLRLPDYPPDFVDSTNRHNPPEGRTLWYNHLGGFEGIAQKLWTSCTIALIHMALWPLGLSYRIIGQGDNQVCILDCYVPRDLSEEEAKAHIRGLVEKAALSIAEVSAKVGQVVKPEECIYSTCFLTYGKEMILRGAYLPTSLKYISRMFPSTTSDAPSLYEMISSISSGASGATERNDWSYPTYYLAKTMEGITFLRESKRSLFHQDKVKKEMARLVGEVPPEHPKQDWSLDLIRLCLAIPSNLGGFPIATLPELMYRGHSDPLTSSLLHLCFLGHIPQVERYKRVVWKGWILDPKPDPTGLIQDPYAIPLKSQSVPSSRVSVATAEVLHLITRNLQFRELLDRATPADKERLVEWLSTQRPLYPKLLHDLYKSSLIGVRDAFARRFTNTRTLIAISRRAQWSISGISLSADFQYISQALRNFHLIWKTDSLDPVFQRSDLYHVAQTLRRAWFKGELLHGVTSAHPLAVGQLHWIPLGGPTPPPPPCLVAMAFTTPSQEGLSTRGPVNPYLGSSTSDKSVAKWVRPVDTSPPLRDVLKILTIRSFVAVEGSALWEGLTNLAQSRSRVSIDVLEKFVKTRAGGVLAHRYHTRDDSRGSFWNSCFNWPSHLTFSTNLAGDLGAKDYPYDFQEAMLAMASLLCWTYSQLRVEPNWGVCLTADLSLMEEVTDRVVDSQPYDLPILPSPNNYYASVLRVSVSSNATSAARLQKGNLSLPWQPEVPPVVHAAAVIFLNHFRGSLPTTTRYGHTIGIPQAKRVIDLPEVSYLSTENTLAALQEALWYKVGLPLALMCTTRSRPPARLLQSLLDLEVRRGIPGLAGTLREVHGGTPLFGLGIGLGRENETDSLARWMSLCLERAPRHLPGGPFTVYEEGSSSVSSLLSAYLGVMAAKECLSGDPVRFQNGKMMARVVKRCLESSDEQSRVRLLALVIRVAGASSHLRVAPTSPELLLRSLRQGGGPSLVHGTHPRVRRIYQPPEFDLRPQGGVAPLSLNWSPLPPSVLVSSWTARLPSVPASAERWAPLSSLHSQVRSVLLLGVGKGDIGGALPFDWKVTGVEQARVLQNLGHSFTTYHPPGLPGHFILHPCSWTTTGDVYSPEVKRVLKEELGRGEYDLVIVDVESGTPVDRLRLRAELASTGVPTYCKILIDPADVPLLTQSWAAYHSPGDSIWTTLSYPMREFIIGYSQSPMGVHSAVPTPDPLDFTLAIPNASDYQTANYPPYTPGPDLLTLTGHIPPLTRRLVLPRQCRALFPFLTNESIPKHLLASLPELCLHLLHHKCPRRRVQALIRLHRASLLSPSFWSFRWASLSTQRVPLGTTQL
jgi:hypothetical protein